ncbi:MAG: HDIG domain-containing protein [bacterium]|nr:HDIG domain-containing protein [bacterium]
MDRDFVLSLLERYVKSDNLRKHMLATEAIMRALARRFNQNEEIWGIAGLIHDIDYELCEDDTTKHGKLSEDILKDADFPEEIIEAVKAHVKGVEVDNNPMHIALCSADAVNGLIIAGALIKPEKSLSAIDTNFILKRFKEKAFARGANREEIKLCEKLGLSLEEFISISLSAMREIHEELGL